VTQPPRLFPSRASSLNSRRPFFFSPLLWPYFVSNRISRSTFESLTPAIFHSTFFSRSPNFSDGGRTLKGHNQPAPFPFELRDNSSRFFELQTPHNIEEQHPPFPLFSSLQLGDALLALSLSNGLFLFYHHSSLIPCPYPPHCHIDFENLPPYSSFQILVSFSSRMTLIHQHPHPFPVLLFAGDFSLVLRSFPLSTSFQDLRLKYVFHTLRPRIFL